MNTENSNQGDKNAFAKFVTFTGLIGIIIFLAWSAIQIVKLFPSALNSLASLADSVYSYKPSETSNKINVTADRAIMNSGETLAIWWENKNDSGTYTFDYSCQDGVALDIRSADKDFSSISCNQTYDLGLIDRIEIKVDSEKVRFTEIPYTITYYKKNNQEATITDNKTISVINPSLSEDSSKTEDASDVITPTKPAPTENKPKDDVPSTPSKPIITKPTQVEPTYIYEIPVSNPKGQIDLLASNLKVGTKNRIGTFINTDRVIKNQAGAIEFVVHNIGNKTSGSWIFETKLPGDVDYISDRQLPLKPNERAVITVSFPTTKDTDLQKISVLIKTDSDKNKNNNYVDKTVIVMQ
jgi:hypothetical protein